MYLHVCSRWKEKEAFLENVIKVFQNHETNMYTKSPCIRTFFPSSFLYRWHNYSSLTQYFACFQYSHLSDHLYYGRDLWEVFRQYNSTKLAVTLLPAAVVVVIFFNGHLNSLCKDHWLFLSNELLILPWTRMDVIVLPNSEQ